MSENTENYNELNEEQIAAQKADLLEFYKESAESLKVQLEYEQLVAQIEEARLARLVAQMRIAQLMAPAPEDDEEEEPAPKRNLKRS